MRPMDTGRFAKAMAVLAGAFRTEMQEITVDAYYMALEDLDIGRIEAACRELVRTSHYFPRPAAIRDVINQAGSVRLIAAEAWSVMVSAGRPGFYSVTPHPTDEVANQAFRLLGTMSMQSDFEGPWAQKQFLEHYEEICDRNTHRLAALGVPRPPEKISRHEEHGQIPDKVRGLIKGVGNA